MYMLGYFFPKFNVEAQGPSANLSGKKSEKNKGFFCSFCPSVQRWSVQGFKN